MALTATSPSTHITRGELVCVHDGSSRLRGLVDDTHMRPFKAFRASFLKAARELAEQHGDPEFCRLDISERQWSRWLRGARPRPYACRVLEYMFDLPIQELIGPADDASRATTAEERTPKPSLALNRPPIVDGRTPTLTLTITALPAGSVQVLINIEPGPAPVPNPETETEARVFLLAPDQASPEQTAPTPRARPRRRHTHAQVRLKTGTDHD